jgi:hypothetical protein
MPFGYKAGVAVLLHSADFLRSRKSLVIPDAFEMGKAALAEMMERLWISSREDEGGASVSNEQGRPHRN